MYRVSEVWIALIYVVIEGYEGLNVRDERVDVLLTDAERVTSSPLSQCPLSPSEGALRQEVHGLHVRRGQPHLVRRSKRRFPRVLRERGPDGRVIRLVWGRAGEGS